MTHPCSIKAAEAVPVPVVAVIVVVVVVIVLVQSCRLKERKKEKGRPHNKISTDHYQKQNYHDYPLLNVCQD